MGTTALRRTDEECESAREPVATVALVGDVDDSSSSSRSRSRSSGRRRRSCEARRQTGWARAMGSSIAVAVMAINRSKIRDGDIGRAGAKTRQWAGSLVLVDLSHPTGRGKTPAGDGASCFEGSSAAAGCKLETPSSPGAGAMLHASQ